MSQVCQRAAAGGIDRRLFVAGAAASVLAAPALVRAATAPPVVVWNWDAYIGPDTVEQFTAATGIEVDYRVFSTNQEVVDAMKAGNPGGVDLVFPSSEYVEQLVRAGLLHVLDYGLMPNAVNIDPFFADALFDPGRAYSLPYFWGTVGLGFRRSVAEPARWSEVLASPPPGRLSLTGTPDMVQAALKMLGHSVNTADPAEIGAAVEVLIAAKPRVTAFIADLAYEKLLSREIDIAMDWNGGVVAAMLEDDDIGYVVPKEGSMLWEDTMCIPATAPNPEGAHAFINFILDAQTHAAIADEVLYACPNIAAQDFIAAENLANPAIYPPADVLARCEPTFWPGEGTEALYEDAVRRVMEG